MYYRVPFMKIKDQKGQSLVEFALILPLLAMILGGLVDLGCLFYNNQILANASREGARESFVSNWFLALNTELKLASTAKQLAICVY